MKYAITETLYVVRDAIAFALLFSSVAIIAATVYVLVNP